MARLSLAGSIPRSGYNGISLQYDLLHYYSNISAVYSHCIERDNIYATTAAIPHTLRALRRNGAAAV